MHLQDIPLPDRILLHTMQSMKLFWEHIDQSTDPEADRVYYSEWAVWMDGMIDQIGEYLEENNLQFPFQGKVQNIFAISMAVRQHVHFPFHLRLLDNAPNLYPENPDRGLLVMKLLMVRAQMQVLERNWTWENPAQEQVVQKLRAALPQWYEMSAALLQSLKTGEFKAHPQTWTAMEETVAREMEAWVTIIDIHQ